MISQRNCGTNIYNNRYENPSLLQKMNDNEVYLIKLYSKLPESNSSTIITIPVVVHVVYYNSNENISDLQIQSQIDILNNDLEDQFRRRKYTCSLHQCY